MFSALVLKLLNKSNIAMSDLFSFLKLIGTSGRLVRIFIFYLVPYLQSS